MPKHPAKSGRQRTVVPEQELWISNVRFRLLHAGRPPDGDYFGHVLCDYCTRWIKVRDAYQLPPMHEHEVIVRPKTYMCQPCAWERRYHFPDFGQMDLARGRISDPGPVGQMVRIGVSVWARGNPERGGEANAGIR